LTFIYFSFALLHLHLAPVSIPVRLVSAEKTGSYFRTALKVGDGWRGFFETSQTVAPGALAFMRANES
jgi:hypothetical protein